MKMDKNLIFLRGFSDSEPGHHFVYIRHCTKASDSGEFTASDVDRCEITFEHVDSILTSQRDEKLQKMKTEQKKVNRANELLY